MHFATLLIVAFAIPALADQYDNFFARKDWMEARSRLAREAHLSTEANYAASTPANPKFSNSKTSKYAVNGSALPFINFDIGESYSGLMPIDSTTNRKLFFWYFPTQGLGSNEITIWLNGGPGCSSLIGFFQENGPVIWPPGTYGPRKNPFALNKLSNVVWVEQPVGTGFSQGKQNASNEVEVGEQFDGFWKNFVDTFDLHNFGVYIGGESYAGMYVPYIADTFLKAGGTTYHNLKGILIYDPVVSSSKYIASNILPAAVPFAKYNAPSFGFDAATWKELDELQESCGYNKIMKDGLTFPPKGPLGQLKYSRECDTYSMIYSKAILRNPCFNIYHVSDVCPSPGDILGGLTGPTGAHIPPFQKTYFNRADVKKVIHAPEGIWTECVENVLSKDTSPGSATAHGPIKRITEQIGNVIVGHGKNDYILLSNQTLLTLNNLVWNGKQGFNTPPNKPLMIPYTLKNNDGRFLPIGGWTQRDGLTFVEVELSGHMIPQYNPRADFRIHEVLHGRVSSLSAEEAFTI